jgi:hypothetical protein
MALPSARLAPVTARLFFLAASFGVLLSVVIEARDEVI